MKINEIINEAPIEQDKDNPVAKPYVDMPEWKALHDMDDKIIDAYIKHNQVKEAAGVGIITKQNTTQDVKPGDEYKNVKKLHLR